MATKKQRRKSKTKKINPKNFIFLFIIFILCFVTLALFFVLSNSTNKKITPIYEEIYSKISDLHREIGKIDNAIYEALYQRKVHERNILFLAVKPRHGDGYDWDFTELLIYLSNNHSVLQFEKTIDTELSHLKPSVIFKKEKANGEIVCRIYALGFFTHKVRLIPNKYPKAINKGLPKIAIIIDDLGYDHDMATSFIQSNLPFSLSVLPEAPHTQDIVLQANRMGFELILHLPMEPKGYPELDPGPGALLIDMDEKDIRQTIRDHLNRVPGVKGVNNHMGSSFTEREDKMSVVLSELKRRNLFYIDSRTTSQTVAFKMAKKAGVPVANRSVFIDNDLSPKAIKYQLERLLGISRHSGSAIGIGHPHKETLIILKDYLDRFKDQVEMVPVSKLVS